MSNILKATKYQLMMFIPPSLVCLSIMALNLLISVTVSYLFPGSGVSAGSSDLIAFIWIYIIGILFFIPSFKFMIANAVSRKHLYWANIFSILILSVAWALIITLLISFVSQMNIEIMVLYNMFYKESSAMGTLAWFIGLFYLLIIMGWFTNMIYYRSSRRMAYVISFSPFILSGLLTLINQSTNGKLFNYILKFIVSAMGFSGSTPNPYIASGSMLLMAVVICGFNYSLIRKVQIKQ